MEIRVGSVVISRAGHDSGRFMLVCAAENGFIYVADGKERKLASPKKKNLRHVRATGGFIEPSGLTDKKLRQTLSAFAQEHVTGE